MVLQGCASASSNTWVTPWWAARAAHERPAGPEPTTAMRTLLVIGPSFSLLLVDARAQVAQRLGIASRMVILVVRHRGEQPPHRRLQRIGAQQAAARHQVGKRLQRHGRLLGALVVAVFAG